MSREAHAGATTGKLEEVNSWNPCGAGGVVRGHDPARRSLAGDLGEGRLDGHQCSPTGIGLSITFALRHDNSRP